MKRYRHRWIVLHEPRLCRKTYCLEPAFPTFDSAYNAHRLDQRALQQFVTALYNRDLQEFVEKAKHGVLCKKKRITENSHLRMRNYQNICLTDLL